MIISYLFYLAGILMINRKVYLFMVPIIVGVSWRFGFVTSLRSFTIDEILVVVSVIKIVYYLILRRFEYRMPLLRWHLIYLLGVAFTFLIGLLLFQSFDLNLNDLILLHFKQRLYLPVIFAAVFVQVQSKEEGLWMLRWTTIVAIPLSLYAIIQYHYFIIPKIGDFGSFWLYSWYDEDSFWKVFSLRRAFGTLGHPAPLGRYLMMMVVVALVQGLHRLEDRAAWRTGLGIALLCFYALGVTGSRGPIVGLAIGIAAIIFLERKSFSKNVIILVIAAMALTYAVPEIMSERVTRTLDEGAEELSYGTRLIMWSDLTTEVMSANPVTGFGPKYEVCYDNDFISIIYEGGFLVLILFMFWVLAMFQLGSVGVQSDSRLAQMCGVIITGCTVAVLGAAFSGRTFFNPKVGITFMYLLAVCGKIIFIDNRERRMRALAWYRSRTEE